MRSMLIRNMPDDLRRLLKILAAETGRSMESLVVEAIREFLKKK